MKNTLAHYATITGLFLCYFVVMDVFHASTYHAFSLDAFHVSQWAACVLAAIIGVLTWNRASP